MNIMLAKKQTIFGIAVMLALSLSGCDRPEPQHDPTADVTAVPATGANAPDSAREQTGQAADTSAPNPAETVTSAGTTAGTDETTMRTLPEETSADDRMRKAKADFEDEKQRCLSLAVSERNACETAAAAAYETARSEAEGKPPGAGTPTRTP